MRNTDEGMYSLWQQNMVAHTVHGHKWIMIRIIYFPNPVYLGGKYIFIIYILCDSFSEAKEIKRMTKENKESHCVTVVFFFFYSYRMFLLFSLLYDLVA